MPNQREMYFSLVRARKEALDILITVQRRCGEWRCSAGGEEPAQAEERAGERSPALNSFYGCR